MSTKSKARAARRTHQEDVILGEIIEALLNAITFGALEGNDNEAESETETETAAA